MNNTRSSRLLRNTSLHGSVWVCVFLCLAGCAGESAERSLFERLDASKTHIKFSNDLGYAYEFNIYRYRNFYNGGGVALGDVNNDGLLDVFFTGNQVANRLYLNEGGFRFTDVTDAAGVSGNRAWSTGVSMADVNGDGWLDIYVCNSGIVEGDDKKNELYINNGDATFTEMAEAYGIADAGLSIHGSFLDYDRDGDLDLYLVNNSFRNIGDFNLEENTRHIPHDAGGDRLYRNTIISSEKSPEKQRVPRFVDVTEEAGIYSSEIGFGLGASAGDVNRDGWPDLYISNDFFERDYLYLNNQDGTFREVLEEGIKSMSAAAMGADMADFNGDGFPEIFVTDMLPDDEYRLKTVSAFDSWERYRNYIEDDYHHQFTRNTLHLNRGHAGPDVKQVQFSEVGRKSGVEASDWSWGALIADLDLDGYRDLFVANGIYQDLTNADYLVQIRDEETMSRLIGENYVDFKTLIEMIPSNPIPNLAFRGRPEVQFKDVTDEWGLAEPGFSNGSAYGDLDNDGDLDLVINNVNMEAFVFENKATDLYPERTWLQIDLEGSPPNTAAVGTQLSAWSSGRLWYAEQQPVRGFQSSIDHAVHFGLGSNISNERLDSLIITWPDGREDVLFDIELNRRLKLGPSHSKEDLRTQAVQAKPSSDRQKSWLEPMDPAELGLNWQHQENEYNDFDRQPLLFHMRSTEGPPICVGDANGDDLDDLYLGGAKDQPGSIYVQVQSGRFDLLEQPALADDAISEDIDCVWFDADGDGDEDLYVASGGSEFSSSSSALIDRLYINDGEGRLTRSSQTLMSASGGFEPTGAVASADYDSDGDIDLFVGTRMRPFAYGIPADGHLLINDDTGQFEEVTDDLAPELRALGMITDADWVDVDGDADLDLTIAGEWMPLTVFINQEGKLENKTGEFGLDQTIGWWNAIEWADLDSDGDLDFVAANHGLNSRFKASLVEPVEMWVDDFDRNGSVEQILAVYQDGRSYPMVLRHDLIDQIPSLAQAYPTYASYAGQTIQDIFSLEILSEAIHHKAVLLESVIGWNEDGQFRIEALPDEVQYAPMYGIEIVDINADGQSEILMGGNLYEAKPEVGRYDASYGEVVGMHSSEMRSVPFGESGFWVDGPARRIENLSVGGHGRIVVARNNDSLLVFGYGK